MRPWVIIGLVIIGIGFWLHNTLFLGQTAPDFTLATASGDTMKLSDQKGNVVLLDFWATWCGPCRASLPHLQEARENEDWAAQGLVVWAVNDRQSASNVSAFLANNGFTFSALLDTGGTVCSEYGVSGIPMTVIVGRNGRVRNEFVGWGDQSAQEIDAAIEKALAEPPN